MKNAAALVVFAAATALAGSTTVGGHRVHYEVDGSGEPAVVLVHGWTCDSSFWRMQVPEMRRSFRTLAIDLPGHGKSARPEIRYDLELFARSVRSAMDSAGIRRAVLVGHSMGAAVIRQVYTDDPGRVIALVSVDGMMFRAPTGDFVRSAQQWAESMRGPEGLEVRRKFIDGMFVSATGPDLRKEISSKMLLTPGHVAAEAVANSITSPLWTAAAVDVPVFAINRRAADDRIERMHKESFRNLTFIEVDGTGHFLHMEKPAEFNRILIDYIRKFQR